MEKRKLLLAEGNEEFAQSLEEGLREQYVVRICRDGQTALQLMHTFRPDILVLDLMLPSLDGISLLQSMAEARLRPMVLATTRYYNDYILEKITQYGVGYLLVKPCDIRATMKRIGDLTKRIRAPGPVQPEPGVWISNTLREFSIRVNLKGYRYLHGAVGMLAEDSDQGITKELYATLAKAHNTSVTAVERCIRTAIEIGWKNRNPEYWEKYFPTEGNGPQDRPSNGAFISVLVERMKTELFGGREYMEDNGIPEA